MDEKEFLLRKIFLKYQAIELIKREIEELKTRVCDLERGNEEKNQQCTAFTTQ